MASCDRPRQLTLCNEYFCLPEQHAHVRRVARDKRLMGAGAVLGYLQVAAALQAAQEAADVAEAEIADLRAKNSRLQAENLRLTTAARAPRSPRSSLPATAPDPARAGASKSTRRASGSGAAGEPSADILDVFHHFKYTVVRRWREGWRINTAAGCGDGPTAGQRVAIAAALSGASVADLRGRMDQATDLGLPNGSGRKRGSIDLEEWLK